VPDNCTKFNRLNLQYIKVNASWIAFLVVCFTTEFITLCKKYRGC